MEILRWPPLRRGVRANATDTDISNHDYHNSRGSILSGVVMRSEADHGIERWDHLLPGRNSTELVPIEGGHADEACPIASPRLRRSMDGHPGHHWDTHGMEDRGRD